MHPIAPNTIANDASFGNDVAVYKLNLKALTTI